MKVYMAKRNADMTEGRGPMVNDLCFLNKEHANEYIDSRSGVMGRKATWSLEKYGDWEVEEIEVLNYSVVDREKQKQARINEALAKLSNEDREVLGIF
jgi:hypothetical protein